MTTTEAQAPTPAEINVDDFMVFVVNMSRLLTGLARIKPFSEANLGLAEWATLSMLAQTDGVSNRQLGRNLGVTSQRVNQICTSLMQAEFIAVSQRVGDSPAKEIKITSAGKAKIEGVNAQLKLLLATVLKGRERALGGAAKQTRQMMRVFQVGAGEGAAKRKERKVGKARQGSTTS